ncbi:MAG: hypothetical protein WCW02_02510 [Candidatus Buchananbacteria bacterium]
MAISKKEALAKLTPKQQEVFNEIEIKIDQALREKYVEGGEVVVCLETQPEKRIQSEIVKRYKAVGWENVLLRRDRDGFYVTIG